MTFEKIVKSEFSYMYRLQTDIFALFSCLHDVDKLLHHQIKNISFFHGLGVPLLLGVSRKSIINKIAKVENPKDRIHGSISVAICALAQGVQVFRVHDVAETKQAVDLWMAVNFGE